MAFVTLSWATSPNYSDAGVPMAFLARHEELAVSGTQDTSEPSLDDETGVRIATDTNIRFAVGASPTVTATTGAYLPAGAVEYVRVGADERVAVIQSS